MATEGEEGTWSEIQQRPARSQPGEILQEGGEIFLDVHFGDQIGTQEDALRHVPVQHLEFRHVQPVTDQINLNRMGVASGVKNGVSVLPS